MHNMKKTIQPNGLLRPKPKLTVLMMLLCKDPLQLLRITITESMPGLIHNTKKLTPQNGRQRPLKLLRVDTMLLLKEENQFTLHKHQILQITTIESTLGPMHNTKKTIQPNGLPRLKPKLMELMMLLCKDPHQLLRITITESMPGLTHNTKKLTLLNGRPKLLKLLKVDTMLLPKEDTAENTEFQETLSFLWKLQQPQIITT
jgi:hypothetical protein